MCDYSLAGLPNRLAIEGEQLVVHRFYTGAIGLASPFPSILNREVPAVCVPPGARLRLSEIPEHLQHELDIGPTEEVMFVQRSADAYAYRDAIRFRNGRDVLLQRLATGQRVDVLSLDSGDSPTVERHVGAEYSRIPTV